MNIQPLAAGAAGGGAASLLSALLWLLDRQPVPPALVPGPLPSLIAAAADCGDCWLDWPWDIDPRSLLLGLLIGAAAGPILDILCLLRHSWRAWVRSRLGGIGQAARRGGQLYTLL